MCPRRKCRKPAKKSFDIEKIIIAGAAMAILFFLPLVKTGLYSQIAGFFDFSGLVKTQIAFAEYNGRMMQNFSGNVVASAGESVSALGAAHGKFVAKLRISSMPAVPTPVDIAAGVFEEMGFEVAGFGVNLASDSAIAVSDVGGALELAFADFDYKTDVALFYGAKGIRAIGTAVSYVYPRALAKQFE